MQIIIHILYPKKRHKKVYVADRLDPAVRQHDAERALHVAADILGFAFLKVRPT